MALHSGTTGRANKQLRTKAGSCAVLLCWIHSKISARLLLTGSRRRPRGSEAKTGEALIRKRAHAAYRPPYHAAPLLDHHASAKGGRRTLSHCLSDPVASLVAGMASCHLAYRRPRERRRQLPGPYDLALHLMRRPWQRSGYRCEARSSLAESLSEPAASDLADLLRLVTRAMPDRLLVLSRIGHALPDDCSADGHQPEGESEGDRHKKRRGKRRVLQPPGFVQRLEQIGAQPGEIIRDHDH